MLSLLPVFALLVGMWALLNGILHDIFILASEHGKKYDSQRAVSSSKTMPESNPKILIVDDDTDLLELLTIRLTAAG